MPAPPSDLPGPLPPAAREGASAPDAPSGQAPAPGKSRGNRPARPGCPCPPEEPRLLPDPAAVRLCLIPESAPPYDGEVPHDGWVTSASGRPAMPNGSMGSGTSPGSGISTELGGSPGSGASTDPGHSTGSSLGPGWADHFAQVLAETLGGSRPVRQMVPWTTERALNRIQRLGPQLAAGQRPRVRRVVISQPTANVMEMTVVVGFGNRVRALAVRLECAGPSPAASGKRRDAARWLCTTVEAA